LNRGPEPLFLFSLPRSGSTLAQRILAAHEQISTVSEPWVLLPYFYALKDGGVFAEYNHSSLVSAVKDFCETLPGGREDYVAEVRDFALRLYGRAAPPGARYFLDKTPRYHLIADEVISAFPEGRHVFLWRNPLAVISSIIETWGHGRWNVYRHKVDLYKGLENLIETYLQNEDRVLAVRYEDLILSPRKEWQGVFDYLDLPFDPAVLDSFVGVGLKGRSGDPTGTLRYDRMSEEPLEGWKRVLCNPFRKRWCRRYLRWLGQERLAVMGYDMGALIDQLDSLPHSYRKVGSDIYQGGIGIVHDAVEPKIIRRKLRTLPAWKRVRAHK
jgi:hypothetical protein